MKDTRNVSLNYNFGITQASWIMRMNVTELDPREITASRYLISGLVRQPNNYYYRKQNIHNGRVLVGANVAVFCL